MAVENARLFSDARGKAPRRTSEAAANGTNPSRRPLRIAIGVGTPARVRPQPERATEHSIRRHLAEAA